MVLWPVYRLVVLADLKNRVRAQLRRIRQPRYLLATVLGLAYWWWYAGRFIGDLGRARPRLPDGLALPLELGLTALGLLMVVLGWVFGSDRGALAFSEAEIQFLFPAPLSRRQLVHYKLLRLLGVGLLGSLLTTLFFGRSLGGSPVSFAVGSWIALTTLSFHNLAASFTRAGLARHGVAGVRRFLLTLLGLLLLGGALALLARRVPAPALGGPPLDALLAWAGALDGSALGWALWPVRAPVRLALAGSAVDFLSALPVALALLALHYAWVMSAVLGFEDGAVADAERRARAVETARRQGVGAVVRSAGRRRPPFQLSPRGRPEVALLWKGLIAAGRTAGLRAFVILGAVLAVVLLVTVVRRFSDGSAELAGAFTASIWGVAVIVGPGMIRADLRLDLANLEALRALPLSGAAMVRGQLLAPLAVLTGLQWLALLLTTSLLLGATVLPAGATLGLAGAAAILGPALTLVALTLQNGFVVLFPAWIPTGPERARGPEALGLRLLSALGFMLALALAVLPAALLGGLVGLVAWPLLGPAGAPLAAAAAAATLGLEAWAATALLGRVFDRLDPSGL